jgi:hypothetical protein
MDLSQKIALNLEIFEKVWERFPEKNPPTWQHFWFYWYLRFSKSYWLTLKFLRTKKLDDSHAKAIAEIPGYAQVLTTCSDFGDVWEKDFTTWWYFAGKYQFFPLVEPKFGPASLFNLTTNKKVDSKYISETLESLEEFLKIAQDFTAMPQVLGAIVPIHATKKKTLKEFEKYLDKTVTFAPKELVKGNYVINKSKLRKQTIVDCYKVLDIRSRYDQPDLANIAIEANVLRGAMADYRAAGYDLKKMNSVESLRSGTSRQIKQAVLIAENAARGIFPSINMHEHLAFDSKFAKEISKINSEITEVSNLDVEYILKFIEVTYKNPTDLSAYLPLRS